MTRILITGGAGYIGSHVAKAMIEARFAVSVVDNLENGNPEAVARLASLGGTAFRFRKTDVRDRVQVDAVFSDFRPDVLVHLAGLKDVAESFRRPDGYRRTNVDGTANLLASASRHCCDHLVFSSSAAVYGAPRRCPIAETAATEPLSPYGQTKLEAEALIQRWAGGAPGRRAIALRYFNPCARDILLFGDRLTRERRTGSLADAIADVAEGLRPRLEIFGRSFPTPDGTCRRDYVHVDDIADAHVRAVARVRSTAQPFDLFNLGSGTDISVLEFVEIYQRTSGLRIPHVFRPPREGDPAVSCADISRASTELGWTPRRDITDICSAIGPASRHRSRRGAVGRYLDNAGPRTDDSSRQEARLRGGTS